MKLSKSDFISRLGMYIHDSSGTSNDSCPRDQYLVDVPDSNFRSCLESQDGSTLLSFSLPFREYSNVRGHAMHLYEVVSAASPRLTVLF
jgi:hypothetical protein